MTYYGDEAFPALSGEQWARLRADDPQWAAYEVYAWLGAVQESLVQALA